MSEALEYDSSYSEECFYVIRLFRDKEDQILVDKEEE